MAEIPNERLSGQAAAPVSDRPSELVDAIRRTRDRVTVGLNRLDGDLRAAWDGEGRATRAGASDNRNAVDKALAYASLARRVYISTTRLSRLLPRSAVVTVLAGIVVAVFAGRRYQARKQISPSRSTPPRASLAL